MQVTLVCRHNGTPFLESIPVKLRPVLAHAKSGIFGLNRAIVTPTLDVKVVLDQHVVSKLPPNLQLEGLFFWGLNTNRRLVSWKDWTPSLWQKTLPARTADETRQSLTYDLALANDAGKTLFLTILYPIINRFSVALFELVPELLTTENNVPFAKTVTASLSDIDYQGNCFVNADQNPEDIWCSPHATSNIPYLWRGPRRENFYRLLDYGSSWLGSIDRDFVVICPQPGGKNGWRADLFAGAHHIGSTQSM